MTYHALKLQTGGLPVTAGINGAPLLSDPTGAGLSGIMPINPWLKPKQNTLSMTLGRPPAATEAPLPAVEVHAQVYTIKAGGSTTDIDTVLTKFDRSAGDPAPLPLNREVAFEIKDPPPARLWTDAAKVSSLLPADVQQLKGLVQKFADALKTQNLDILSALLDYKTKDCALANGQDPGHMRQVIRDLFANGMFKSGSYRVEGAQAAQLQFKLIAGGQVVWMFQSQTQPALVVLAPTKRFTLPMFAGKIAGSWQIVR